MKTVVLTFDYWPDAYNTAFGLMYSRGLVGTWFVDHRSIDATSGAYALGITRDKLTQMKIEGWTIGAYLGENMVSLLSYDRNDAIEFIKAARDTFWAKGFSVQSVAPNQRAWNKKLRNLAVGVFRRVRVGCLAAPQCLPVADPLYIDKGGVPSLDNGDTPTSVNATIDAFLADPNAHLLQFVVHKIGAIPADYTVSVPTFTALIDRLALEQNTNKTLVAVGYDDLAGAI